MSALAFIDSDSDRLHAEMLQGHEFGRVAAQAQDGTHVCITCEERLGDLAAEVAGGTC